MTNSHLTPEERESIQDFINKNYSFTKIGKIIKRDRTTISKEIKRNRYIKSFFYDKFDPKGIEVTIKNCSKLSNPPYVCNSCEVKNRCTKHKLYYNHTIAQKNYEKNLTSSREGIDITPEQIDVIEKNILGLIKHQKQTLNQVYINHPGILTFSKSTMYHYINIGVFSITNFDLPKKVKYKKREKKIDTSYKRNYEILDGRRYEDYLELMAENSSLSVVEMDCVEGLKTDSKALFTIMLKETKLMLMFLLDKQTSDQITQIINELKDTLGIKLYSKVFRVLLTDNGKEFFNPYAMEQDFNNGKKVSNVFYCKPYSAWQKGSLEKNHVFIRKVWPKSNEFGKGTSFDSLNEKMVKELENNINNIPRDILGGKTPYELTQKKYPKLIERLNIKYIKPDDVDMNPLSYQSNQ